MPPITKDLVFRRISTAIVSGLAMIGTATIASQHIHADPNIPDISQLREIDNRNFQQGPFPGSSSIQFRTSTGIRCSGESEKRIVCAGSFAKALGEQDMQLPSNPLLNMFIPRNDDKPCRVASVATGDEAPRISLVPSLRCGTFGNANERTLMRGYRLVYYGISCGVDLHDSLICTSGRQGFVITSRSSWVV